MDLKEGVVMAGLKDTVQLQTVLGEPITVGGVTVTPQSQALSFRWPNGGIVWNRPIAVLVDQDGETERLRIVDVTRVIQLGVIGLSFVLAIFAFTRSTRRRRE
jgi:hypothetical protein